MTTRKLESQFEQVDRAFAWILMRRFVISAGLDLCQHLDSHSKAKGSV
jgi:hypothetical protein